MGAARALWAVGLLRGAAWEGWEEMALPFETAAAPADPLMPEHAPFNPR